MLGKCKLQNGKCKLQMCLSKRPNAKGLRARFGKVWTTCRLAVGDTAECQSALQPDGHRSFDDFAVYVAV